MSTRARRPLTVDQPPRRTSRRTRVVLASLIAVGALITGAGAIVLRDRDAQIPLYSRTAALDGDGRPVLVEGFGEPAGGLEVPGSRVLAGPRQQAGLDVEARWLAAGSVPTGDCGHDEATCTRASRDALLDLHVLLRAGGGVPVAGWSPQWRFVWPRDAAFAVAALDATGHPDDAAAVLDFLQRVQHADGTFEARYRPDGSGPPDARGVQLDGSGWALWALDRHLAALPAGTVQAAAARWDALSTKSTAAILRAIDTPDALPPPGPDYWERHEKRLTLGVAAPLLAGLQAAARIADRTGGRTATGGDARTASPAGATRDDLDAAARRLERAILARWQPKGFTRDAGRAGLDAAVTFLLPPFVTLHDDAAAAAVRAAWAQALVDLARPGGGLAPGRDWHHDGVSWTPETGLFALTAAAAGRPDQGRRLLGWIVDHRTAAGSYPEKVLHDGSPAAVAPLAWTAALVLLCLTNP